MSCLVCPAGRFRDSNIPASSIHDQACVACASGRFQTEANQTSCSACAAGKRGTGATAAVQEGLACTPCDPGTFQGEEGQSACVPCAAGKFRVPSVEASAPENQACQACGPGEYEDRPQQEGRCKACGPPSRRTQGPRSSHVYMARIMFVAVYTARTSSPVSS